MPVLTKINTNVIADDAVTSAKIPADALGATDIAANAIGTSEIATGGVLPANIAYLGDGTGNLSGTITNQQLHFGTAFTLTDNLTVNGDVTLGKVRDDGTGQSITGDGKTLTGTGTLTMGGSVEGVPQTRDVDGKRITGTLGSAVTLADGFTLGSGVTYPAGHVIGVQHIVDTSAFTSSSTGYAVACSSAAYTIKNASSTLWITGHFQLNFSNSNAKIKSVWSTNDFTNVTTISESDSWGIRNNNAGLIDFLVPFSEKYTHGLAVGATIRFRMYANRQGGGGTTSLNENDSARMTILEVM